MGSQQNFRYRVEERRTRQISGGGGGGGRIKRGEERGRRLDFGAVTKVLRNLLRNVLQ
jgi:hypothetical protein